MTRWEQAPEAERTGIRLDRIFRAGPAPGQNGEDFVWIIDYKTATHGPEGLDDFIARERLKYQPQLELYARALAATLAVQEKPPLGLRLALYYPALRRLDWWIPPTTVTPIGVPASATLTA